MAIGVVALVVVVVVVIVAVKVTGGGSSGTSGIKPPATAPASAKVLSEVENVSPAVQSAVGSGGSNVVSAPTLDKNQPALKLGSSTQPAALYIGGVFCPYCGFTRWSLLMAFSKFGTFSGVRQTYSSPWDVYPLTPTFDFSHVHYTSQYINFVPVEYLGQDRTAAGTHAVLTPLTKEEGKVYATYDTSQGVPFVDIDNQMLITSAPLNPQLVSGLRQSQVAAKLSDASSPITQAVVGLANQLIAGVCSADGQQPAAVCSNAGVKTAASALGIG